MIARVACEVGRARGFLLVAVDLDFGLIFLSGLDIACISRKLGVDDKNRPTRWLIAVSNYFEWAIAGLWHQFCGASRCRDRSAARRVRDDCVVQRYAVV